MNVTNYCINKGEGCFEESADYEGAPVVTACCCKGNMWVNINFLSLHQLREAFQKKKTEKRMKMDFRVGGYQTWFTLKKHFIKVKNIKGGGVESPTSINCFTS